MYEKTSLSFNNQNELSSSGSGNFGRDGCLFFASKGAKMVVALDNNSNALEETKRYVQSHFSSDDDKVATFECDVTSKASVEKVIDSVCETWGVPDMLWNNAG